MNNTFWILWGFTILVSLVVLYFFFAGLADGSVSSFNSGIWTILLIVIIGIPIGSLWLKNHDQLKLAKILLGVIAGPGFLFLVFMLMMLILKPKWN